MRRTLSGKTRPAYSAGFASASLWGKYATAASRYPESQTLSGYRKDLEGEETDRIKSSQRLLVRVDFGNMIHLKLHEGAQ